MDNKDDTRELVRRIPFWLGWLVVIGALGQLPMILVAVQTMSFLPEVGGIMLIWLVPTTVVLFAGGTGLVYGRTFGYYLVYLAVLFGGIGGLKKPLLPLLKTFVSLGPYTEDLYLFTNLIVVGVLAWDQLRHVNESRHPNRQRWSTAVVLVFGLASIGFGQWAVQRKSGWVAKAENLPIVGASLSDLTTPGRIRFFAVHEKLQHGLILVFAGKSTEQSVKAVAAAHSLTAVVGQRRNKLFPQVKTWKLHKEFFPTEFGINDLAYFGRMKNEPKMLLQIGYRKSDHHFTAQVFGILKENK
jgi:hypothetical protein